jgi:hypothetical protein
MRKSETFLFAGPNQQLYGRTDVSSGSSVSSRPSTLFPRCGLTVVGAYRWGLYPYSGDSEFQNFENGGRFCLWGPNEESYGKMDVTRRFGVLNRPSTLFSGCCLTVVGPYPGW